MALIKCKECDNEIGTSAITCPEYGSIVPEKKEEAGWIAWIAPIFIMVFIILGNIFGSEAASNQAAITPQEERMEVLSFDNTYDINYVKKVRGDLWVLAKTYPQARTICLFVTTVLGTDKYGNPQSGKAIVVAEAAELNELRKYKNEIIASQNALLPKDMFDKRTCPSEAVHIS